MCLTGPEGPVVGGGEELLERSVFPWYFRCWYDVNDADITFISLCSCSNDWNRDIKFNFLRSPSSDSLMLTIVNALHEGQAFLVTLTATSSWRTVSQFCGFGSPSLGQIVLRLWLSEEFFWVRHRIPLSGPTTRPKASHSQSLFVLVRRTHCSSQRDPSLKWNISTWSLVILSNKHTVLCWQSCPVYYYLKLNFSCAISSLTPFSSLLYFSRSPSTPCCLAFPPFGTIFHSISILSKIQISSTPLFYSSMSSPLLWEWLRVLQTVH